MTTLIVSDSENRVIPLPVPPAAPEGGGNALRNPGWKTGIRGGCAKDGSLLDFIWTSAPFFRRTFDRTSEIRGLSGAKICV